ncbi:DUF58 domain-containing protein [Auraticoccus sp. F435]|uniref:DUF58 domain-containing protein n=1 Tax=Auraticoccus cholistanensis TaxID=2656650 RepID=A0A6A9UUY3_9ACTN|nr:DUF58 domain-containing protein [Auraticoccus cholistanensis]MVA75442.1 DUF58 domain-containing protein [Auraticoccus cholistanensis]
MELRPATSLVRAALLTGLSGLLVLLTHRVELLVVVAPFLTWCALGVARRPAGPLPTPTSELGAHRLHVGEVVEQRVSAPGSGLLLELDLPAPARGELDPPLGAAVGVEEAVVRVRPQRWGRHLLQPREVRVSDDWNLWSGSWTPPASSLTVAPGRDAPGGGEAIPHPVGLVGTHPSRSRGEGSSLAEVRRFQVGDRLRRINWRVTSRTGALHTNATTADRDTDVLVVVDTLADLAVTDEEGRSTSDSSLDITVLAAATVAEHYLRLGDRVGLHDLGWVIGSVPTGAGSRQRAVLVEQLAGASVERIARSRLQRIRRVRPGSLVVVCSPLLDPDVLEEVLRLVHRGAAVLAVDTLPAGLGRLPSRARGAGAVLDALSGRFRAQRFWDEAWALRRLERDVELAQLARLGVPVVAWQGMESLALVVAALSAGRTAPRLARGSSVGGGA